MLARISAILAVRFYLVLLLGGAFYLSLLAIQDPTPIRLVALGMWLVFVLLAAWLMQPRAQGG